MMEDQAQQTAKRQGAATVEMAIIGPLLVLLIFGIIELGWYFMARQMIHHACAEAARMATLQGYEVDGAGAGQWVTLSSGDAIYDRIQDLLMESLKLEAGEFGGGGVAVQRNPATSEVDPCETVHISVPIEMVRLPGIIMQAWDHPIQFQVTLAHPTFAGVAGEDGSTSNCESSNPG